ncbi:MAG: hypothetical protein R6U32_07090 [Candidatus Woesearchaeota archaeon]
MKMIERMNKSRKAQMEMIGLAIVVVLLVVGMAFVFKALTKTPERAHEEFTKEQTAQSILISIGRSVTGCREMDLTELMQDCADNVNDAEDLELGKGGRVQCGSKGSCIYVNDSLKWIFRKTLEVQRLPYRFTLYKSSLDNPILYMDYGPGRMPPCNDYNIKQRRYYNVEKPGELTLPLPSGGTVYARLDICTRE